MGTSEAPFRTCIVGCKRGTAYAAAMAETGEFDLVAVCDLIEERAQELVEEFGRAAAYTDYEAMLQAEEPEVVGVATDNSSHAELTIAAAEAGAAGIVCEKPMAVSMGEARAMAEACRTNDCRLVVTHQRRMSRVMVQMRRLMEQGAIGEIELIRASCAGDVLSDGTHAVDSVRWLAADGEVSWLLGQIHREKPDPDEPKGMGHKRSGSYRYGHPVEDGGFGVFEFESGVRAEVLCGDVRLPWPRQYQDYEVFGTEGRLWRPGDRNDPPLLIQDEAGGGYREVEIESEERRGAMTTVWREFARFLREGGSHPLSMESALKDHEVVMSIYESARAHRRIEPPLEQEEFPLRLMLEEGQL